MKAVPDWVKREVDDWWWPMMFERTPLWFWQDETGLAPSAGEARTDESMKGRGQ